MHPRVPWFRISAMRVRTSWLVGVLSLAACTSAATKQSVRLYEGGDYQGAAVAADRGIAADRKDEGSWRMRVRAALALGDAAGVAETYARYREAHGGDDGELAIELAQVTLRQGLASPSVALRIAAIRAVEESELSDLADAVAERMADQDDRVVATAAAAVLRGYSDAATALDDMLHSEDPEARRIALDGLGRKMAKHAVAELSGAAGDGEAAVRRTALAHLSALHDAELAVLFQRHLADPDDGVRAEAAAAFAALVQAKKAQAAAALVLPASAKDSALVVRMAAVALAAALEDRGTLAALLADAEVSVALAAAAALHDRGTQAALAPIFDRALAANAAWPDKVAALNQATALLGAAAAQQRARVAAADPEPAVRLAAARALAHSGARPEAIALLAAAIEPGEAATPSSVPGGTATSDGGAPSTKGASARAVEAAVDLIHLGDLRGEAALSRVLRNSGSAELRQRAAAAHRLARKITPALLAALADPSGAVRVEAAAALAALARAARE
jgi:HEAT repeat protein